VLKVEKTDPLTHALREKNNQHFTFDPGASKN
jgi:hypothetical protein